MKEVMYFENDEYNTWRHKSESTEQFSDNSVAENNLTIDISDEEPQMTNSEQSSNANEVNFSSQQLAPETSNLPASTNSSVPAPAQNPTYPVNQSKQILAPVNNVACPFFTHDVRSNAILQRCHIADAGVSYSQAQQLNFNNYSNLLKLDYNVQANLEAERHLYETKSIEAQFKGNSSYSTSSDCAVTMPNGEKFNWNDLRRDFINEYVIVKDRVSSTVLTWIRERDSNRHIPTSDAELKNLFKEFVIDKMGWDFEFSEKEVDQESKKLIRQIPMLSQSDVKKLNETVLAFENGYFDIMKKGFQPIYRGGKFFNKFSMLYPFDENASNPDAFDAVLYDMFDGKECLIKLAYQIIGAIISPVSTLKRIYVFQGVSHGGKTRLSNIILRLIDENDVYSFNTVSDITNEEFVKKSHNCRLVYIKDCSRHKLKDKQISYLKSFADGGRLSNSAVFKILICTNYKIVTGDNGFLEPALKNRFQTLQFPKAMDNVDEKVIFFEEHFFEKEKAGIVKKALEAFHNVMVNGGRFSYDFPINECVEATNAEEQLTEAEKARVETELQQEHKIAESKLEQVVNKLFIFTGEKCELSAQEVFQTLNRCLPNEIKDSASMGRKMTQIFNGKFKTNRKSDGTFYNLQYRNATPVNEA